MKNIFFVALFVLGSVVLVTSDKICVIDGTEVEIPDTFECETYVAARMESFRFPTFPWIRFPPILSTLWPIFTRRPTTPSPDDDDDYECPEEGIKIIPHPDYCEKYIICVYGLEVERRCPDGQHFSREEGVCMDKEDADCEIERKWECPDEDDLENIVFLPNEEDCQKYYVCFGGERYPLSCADGMHWSIEEEACMDEDEANCEFEDIEECPDEGVKEISHPYDCEKYILCVHGHRIKRSCPDGLHFSREERQCMEPDEAGCDDDIEQCPDEGVKEISHPDDCGMFILCVNGNRIERDCPEGLHFSRELRACVDPDIAECEDEEQCPDEGVKNIPHPDDCEKYILCVNGNRIKRNCAPGLHFSRELRTCVDPDIAECDDDDTEECPEEGIKSISHPDYCEKYILCVNGVEINRDCPPGLHFSREERICMDPEEAGCDDDIEQCPDEGVKSIAHPDSCEKYILCVNGNRIERECGHGLHFSRDLRTCVDPDKAECEDDDNEECPEDGVKSISHPDSCEKYILCVGGIEIPRHCPPGLHFSREHRACVDPEDADCEDHDGKLKCPKEDDWDNIVFLPSLENCQKYYICVGGEPIQMACADGFHWSVENEMCLPEEDADCEVYDYEQCPDEGVKSISHPDNCEKYILCVHGNRIKRDCPPGLHFSREERVCMDPADAECDDDDTEECPEEGIKQISHPYNCEKFILCINGMRLKRECPSGLHFSRENRICMSPEDAECEDHEWVCPAEDVPGEIVFIPNTEDCQKYYVCFGGEGFPLSCADGFHWSIEEEDCLPEDEADCNFGSGYEECPEEGVESIPHPDSCEKYVLCVGGSRIYMECAPGFHFSRELRSCVHQHLADCE